MCGVPSLAGLPTISMVSPSLSVSLRQPLRYRPFGGGVSPAQLVTLPSAPVTSICTQECGLTHSILVNLPLIVIDFDSYSAENEWCAMDGSAATKAIAALSTAIFNFIRTSRTREPTANWRDRLVASYTRMPKCMFILADLNDTAEWHRSQATRDRERLVCRRTKATWLRRIAQVGGSLLTARTFAPAAAAALAVDALVGAAFL